MSEYDLIIKKYGQVDLNNFQDNHLKLKLKDEHNLSFTRPFIITIPASI